MKGQRPEKPSSSQREHMQEEEEDNLELIEIGGEKVPELGGDLIGI